MNRRATLSVRASVLVGALAVGCGGPSPAETDAFVAPDVAVLWLDAGRPDVGPETCGTEGMTRTAACGNCGLESQTCTAGFWVGDGTCLSQGMCASGATESRMTGMCQEERRICDSTCAWRDWSPVGSPGVCMPGAIRSVEGGACGAGTWTETCNDMCAWASTCEDPCRGMRRTAPFDEEEICVPGGEFVRGGVGYLDSEPVSNVFVSTFLIDRYPVTNRRFLACRADMQCLTPVPNHEAGWDSPARADYPVSASFPRALAEEFCNWAGGRLPTEAEYEKAFRGPAPRATAFPWGDSFDCARFPTRGCPGVPSDASLEGSPRPVTGLPGVRSFYGVDMLTGAGRAWTRDSYDPDFYARPDSLRDPVAADAVGWSGLASVRGSHLYMDFYPTIADPQSPLRIFSRGRLVTGASAIETRDMTIRCVRSVPSP
jgi:formylglycine-generating enzyme required for sulfatase activity